MYVYAFRQTADKLARLFQNVQYKKCISSKLKERERALIKNDLLQEERVSSPACCINKVQLLATGLHIIKLLKIPITFSIISLIINLISFT